MGIAEKATDHQASIYLADLNMPAGFELAPRVLARGAHVGVGLITSGSLFRILNNRP